MACFRNRSSTCFSCSLVLWIFSGIVDDPVKRSRWFSLGLSLGTLALTRENALLLIIPILWWRLRQSNVSLPSRAVPSTVVAFSLGLLVVLSPVAVRNRLVGGEWHLTTSQFGPNFYLGNNPGSDGTAGALREGRGSVEYERQDATDLAQAAGGTDSDTAVKSPAFGPGRHLRSFAQIPGSGYGSRRERSYCWSTGLS